MGVVEGQNEPPAHIHIISTSSTSSTTADLTLTTATPSTKPSRALLPPYAHAPPRVHIPVPQDPRLEASHSEVESHDVSLAEDALVVCAGVIRGRVGAGLGEGHAEGTWREGEKVEGRERGEAGHAHHDEGLWQGSTGLEHSGSTTSTLPCTTPTPTPTPHDAAATTAAATPSSVSASPSVALPVVQAWRGGDDPNAPPRQAVLRGQDHAPVPVPAPASEREPASPGSTSPAPHHQDVKEGPAGPGVPGVHRHHPAHPATIPPTTASTQPRYQAGSSSSPPSPDAPHTPPSPSSGRALHPSPHAQLQPLHQYEVEAPSWRQDSLMPPARGAGDQAIVDSRQAAHHQGRREVGVAGTGRESPARLSDQLSVELQALVDSFRQAACTAPQRPPPSPIMPPTKPPAAAPYRADMYHHHHHHEALPAPPLSVMERAESCSPDVRVTVSECSRGGEEEGVGVVDRRVEALSSPTWRGSFLLERDLTVAEDDWGASDESITFVFMSPEDEAAAHHPAASSPPPPPPHRSGDHYRSSPDLSQAGVSRGAPITTTTTHPYDLYRAAGGSLARAASLDTVSRALGRLGAARQRAGLTRTCSLEEEASQELRDILERGRRCSSEESLQEGTPPPSPAGSITPPRPASTTPSSASPEPRPSTTRAPPPCHASPSPCPPPSPDHTFGDASWPDMKSLILGRPPPPPAARRLSSEGSRSSPQLHRRAAAKGLGKKAVSWTDLHGGGHLETEVVEGEGERAPPPPAGPSPSTLRSIMKKPSLAPIAPTPPPPTPPTPKLPSPSPPPLSPPKPPPPAHTPPAPDASSDEDSLPLPRSNLRHMFALRLPQHIRDRALRAPPTNHSPPTTTTTIVSPPCIQRAPRPSLAGGVGVVRPSASLSTEEGGSSTSLSSAVFPSRAASSSGVSCSGYSSTGAISSPGGFSPLREATTASRVLDALSPGRPVPPHTRTSSSSVASTPTDGVFTAPASPSTTLSAPTTPTLNPRPCGGVSVGLECGVGAVLDRCHSEGDLAGRGGAGLTPTWHTLSRVVQEAGQVLKTLSETSLALRQQALSPARTAPLLPPLPEEVGGAPARRVSSVGVQTDPRDVRGLWRDVYTSCDSLSDGEASEDVSWPAPPRRWLQVPRPHHHAHTHSPTRGTHEWRERRERLSRPSGYGGRSSSSEWDSPSPGCDREGVGVGGDRCLGLQRRLEESCRRLEDRLRHNAHKRHLRRQILSEHHNHYNSGGRCVLHSSLDSNKTPLCTHVGPPVPSPYLSTPTLPTAAPLSPAHLRASPCCCVSPVHLPRHQYCRALASPCSAHVHSHCTSTHTTPTPEPSRSPVYRESRVQASRQQCREHVAAARRLMGGGSSSSLGEGSSPTPTLRHRPRLYPAGGSLDAHQRLHRGATTTLDTPYLRGHAASLSSLPGAGGAWRRGGLGGVSSLGSVVSEGEAERRRASCWRGDYDHYDHWRHDHHAHHAHHGSQGTRLH